MWGVGFLGITVCFFQRQQQGRRIREFQAKKISAVSRARPEELNLLLSRYLDEVFPVVFQSRSYVGRMAEEVLKHHRYVALITSRADVNKKMLTCSHLLTVQTMLMFLLALCYELQVSSLPSVSSLTSLSIPPTLSLTSSPLTTGPALNKPQNNLVSRSLQPLIRLILSVAGSSMKTRLPLVSILTRRSHGRPRS
jgi:hypothetical protein